MTRHVPVLLHQAVNALNLHDGTVFLDGTLGGGGHSTLVAGTFHNRVTIIGLDRDEKAVREAGERLRPLTTHTHLLVESFRDLDTALAELGIQHVDAILFDLGISSDQLESSGRGFSFMRDEPLDMRMSETGTLTAETILNTWDEETLELILRGFGEERYSKKIAEEIVERRGFAPFRTTFNLVEAVRAATPSRYQHARIHPATRTFQALRIAVNEELTALEEGISKALEALSPKGRLAVITFHSLEDRIVKNYFRDQSRAGRAVLITKKPIVPAEKELQENPRARSAKLRVIEKI